MDALLTLLPDGRLRVEHDGAVYEPVPDDAALGALLFVLRPGAVRPGTLRHADLLPLRLSADAAAQHARLVQRLADSGDRQAPALPPSVPPGAPRAWMQAAARAVPVTEHERFSWRLARRLGADPWGDGSPAVHFSQQQFGLFSDEFEEDAEGRVVPTRRAEAGPVPGTAPPEPPAGAPARKPARPRKPRKAPAAPSAPSADASMTAEASTEESTPHSALEPNTDTPAA